MKIMTVALAAASALALTVVSGGAAHAANGDIGALAIVCAEDHPSAGDNRGARVCFDDRDNTLIVCDTEADGHHPAALWRTFSQEWIHYKHENVGNGKCGYWFTAAGVTDQHWIEFKACTYEGSTQLSCSAWRWKVA